MKYYIIVYKIKKEKNRLAFGAKLAEYGSFTVIEDTCEYLNSEKDIDTLTKDLLEFADINDGDQFHVFSIRGAHGGNLKAEELNSVLRKTGYFT